VAECKKKNVRNLNVNVQSIIEDVGFYSDINGGINPAHWPAHLTHALTLEFQSCGLGDFVSLFKTHVEAFD
jgi:hypothetical protein